jgi:hypothetical protein
MIVVAIVGLNVGAARALAAFNSEMLVGIVLAAVAVQVGLALAIRGRGRTRAFWLGFVLCGTVAMMSFAWGMLFPRILGLTSTGKLIETRGSPLYMLWWNYAQFVFERIGPWLQRILQAADPETSPLLLATRAIVWFLPQFVLALIGGIVGWTLSVLFMSRNSHYAHSETTPNTMDEDRDSRLPDRLVAAAHGRPSSSLA